MANTDLSRSAFDPRKRYAAVQMQQGRVIVDADWNESGEILAETTRRALLDVVGPHGTQDDGLRIGDPVATAGGVDFAIRAGSYYVGGLRASLHEDERYLLQPDWLELTPPARPGTDRLDLVYVEAWQQPVGAVEDEELREVALGGPDTSTRLRTMVRIGVEPDIGEERCASAWSQAIARWAARGDGALSSSMELVSGVRLTVDYAEDGEADDLCEPSVAGGYLGAENQAIRVQVVDATHITWGFDNASPLYRVTADAARTMLTLENEPVDQAHWPLAGDVVEVLPWSAVLPNGEKVAEVTGHLTTVAASYHPDDGTLTIADAAPATLDRWQGREDAADLGAAFYYLRAWHRGAERSQPAAIACPTGTPVTLGTTGIRVTLGAGPRRPGDHWIIAARPEAPDRVVPWDLEQGRPAHGIRRFRAPLAIVEWSVSGANVTGEVISDCRAPFHPLTHQRGCVTYTVGDGMHSHGDFTSIQDAIDALPREGGEVHVLPGEYREHVAIGRRRDVVLAGCGARSVILPEEAGVAACRVAASTGITVRDLRIEAPAAIAVHAGSGGEQGRLLGPVRDLVLSGLEIASRDLPAVRVEGAVGVTLRDSAIDVAPLERDIATDERGRWPAVYLAATDVRVEGNRVRASGREGARRTALGGVQVAGGSERVVLRGNAIHGGNGHGITLGSVAWVPEQAHGRLIEDYARAIEFAIAYPTGFAIAVDQAGCVTWNPRPGAPPVDGSDEILVPVSEGALRDVHVVENLVEGTGGSGISVAHFFDFEVSADCIAVENLRIERNRIQRCLQGEVQEPAAEMREYVGFGGIALGGVSRLLIADNAIEGNGRSHIDPVCGVFALEVEGGTIARNLIAGNGPRVARDQSPRPGQRGGIVIVMTTPPAVAIASGGKAASGRFGAACTIVDNEVVVPEGRALRVTGAGTIVVSRNHLVSLGFAGRAINGVLNAISMAGQIDRADPRTTAGVYPALLDLLGGGAVAITNLGVPAATGEIGGRVIGGQQKAGSPATGMREAPGDQAGMLDLSGQWQGQAAGANARLGGTVFHDNQVVLDLGGRDAAAPASSVLLLSAGDVSVQQCVSDVRSGAVLVNAFVEGVSVRVSSCRFALPLTGVIGLSALTYGVMNATTANQGTHCFLVRGHVSLPQLVVDEQNRSLIQAASAEICQALGQIAVGVNTQLAQAASTPQQVLQLLR